MSSISSQAIDRNIEQISAIAMGAKELLGYGQTAQIPVEHLVEVALCKALPDFVYDIVSMAKMGENEGLASPDNDFIALREDVYERAKRGIGRDRFTVAHELGHLILHQSHDLVHRRGTGELKKISQPEWQADQFAAEFLMDRRLITEYDTERSIARRFGVSFAAGQRRLVQLRQTGFIKTNGPKLSPRPIRRT